MVSQGERTCAGELVKVIPQVFHRLRLVHSLGGGLQGHSYQFLITCILDILQYGIIASLVQQIQTFWNLIFQLENPFLH